MTPTWHLEHGIISNCMQGWFRLSSPYFFFWEGLNGHQLHARVLKAGPLLDSCGDVVLVVSHNEEVKWT